MSLSITSLATKNARGASGFLCYYSEENLLISRLLLCIEWKKGSVTRKKCFPTIMLPIFKSDQYFNGCQNLFTFFRRSSITFRQSWFDFFQHFCVVAKSLWSSSSLNLQSSDLFRTAFCRAKHRLKNSGRRHFRASHPRIFSLFALLNSEIRKFEICSQFCKDGAGLEWRKNYGSVKEIFFPACKLFF